MISMDSPKHILSFIYFRINSELPVTSKLKGIDSHPSSSIAIIEWGPLFKLSKKLFVVNTPLSNENFTPFPPFDTDIFTNVLSSPHSLRLSNSSITNNGAVPLSSIRISTFCSQPILSFTTTLWRPGSMSLNIPLACEIPLNSYIYGAVPPEANTVKLPFFSQVELNTSFTSNFKSVVLYSISRLVHIQPKLTPHPPELRFSMAMTLTPCSKKDAMSATSTTLNPLLLNLVAGGFTAE